MKDIIQTIMAGKNKLKILGRITADEEHHSRKMKEA
nr:MAG TPA: hypothetical protein [Caudoviricetes sp.]